MLKDGIEKKIIKLLKSIKKIKKIEITRMGINMKIKK
jgi:hypothetical protein